MDILKESFEYLHENAAEAVRLSVRNVDAPGLAPGKLAVVIGHAQRVPELKVFDYPVSVPVATTLRAPKDLAEYIRDRDAVLFIDDDKLELVAYLAGGKAETLEDGIGLLHVAKTTLKASKQWEQYLKGIKGTPAEVIKLQKRMFANEQVRLPGMEPIDSFCTKWLWKVKATVNRETRSDKLQGGDSMGADVTKQVLSEEGGAWPDFVSVTLDVFDNVPYTVTLPMVLEFDAEKTAVILEPVDWNRRQALEDSLAEVVKHIGETAAHVYHGRPAFVTPARARVNE